MGCIASKPSFITSTNGTLGDYQKRYLETKTLGEGEFGVVKLAHDVTDKDLVCSKPLAVKYLRKGFQYKDNVLYSPIKKEVLIGEVEILRRLNGECYNLKLVSVYETPSQILLVTEYCEGGEMVPYVTSAYNKEQGELRTEDVSRICYQLFSAVNHCAKHGVIHRDIKPENVMFCTNKRGSDLRLIDFGSGTLDNDTNPQDHDDEHHTFAGSAFYISPEMFQRMYTSKTDVWSAGATLYVLVAGYPADQLQQCFNLFQSDEPNRIRKLPNIPDNMPDSFFVMLEGAMKYRPKARSTAGELLQGEFVQFHINHAENDTESTGDDDDDCVVESTDDLPPRRSIARTKSVLLEGAVGRHSSFLGYQSFERSLTTLLATMLPKDQCKKLVTTLRSHHQSNPEENGESTAVKNNASKLQVIPVIKMVKIIEEMETKEAAEAIKQIQSMTGYSSYQTYAYHISMLRQFVSLYGGKKVSDSNNLDSSQSSDKSIGKISSVHGGNVWNTFKSSRMVHGRLGDRSTIIDDSVSRRGLDSSRRSLPSGGMRRINTATGALSSLSR